MTVTGNPRIRKDEPLYVIFERFSQFGNKTVYTSADTNQASRLQAQSKDPAILDGTRFVKLFKDAGIMDAKVIHTTELDIIFNKVKGKSERRITFTQFREACRLVARKKYLLNSPSTTAASVDEEDLQDSNDTITPATEDLKEKEALQKLDDLLLKCSGPTLVSTTNAAAPTFHASRMTLDPKMLPSRRESTLNNRRESTAVNPSSRLSGNSGPRLSLHPHAPSVFDRLTDSKLYTGTHKLKPGHVSTK